MTRQIAWLNRSQSASVSHTWGRKASMETGEEGKLVSVLKAIAQAKSVCECKYIWALRKLLAKEAD
jgi:hypothetical protein